MRAIFGDAPEHPHFAQRLLVRHVAHTAGIEQHHVGVGLAFDLFIPPSINECATCSESRSFIWHP